MSQRMSYKAILAALALLGNSATAHMIMKTPKPFGNPDNSPLSSSGSNFPCKLSGDPKTFYDRSDATEMAVGTDQTLSFTGSAVHGGGSCQLAITNDLQPSASSAWSTILSLEGGCPSKDGSGPSEYSFQIPSSVPAGDYVFAWTWISKLAGQPEYYMNCAPIKVTGGSSKRSYDNETLDETELFARDDSMPNLFVANMGSINDCKTEPGTDPVFPVPGPNVEKPGTSPKYANVQGECWPKGGSEKGVLSGSGSTSGSSTGSSGSSSVSSSAESSAAPSSAAPSAPASSAPAATSAYVQSSNAPSASSVTEGNGATVSFPAYLTIKLTSATSSGAFVATPTADSSSAAASPTGFVTSVVSSTPAADPTDGGAASSTPAAASSASAPSASGSAGGLTGACSEEGMFNCVGGTSYQQCASGQWSVMMTMASGTTCKEGQSSTL